MGFKRNFLAFFGLAAMMEQPKELGSMPIKMTDENYFTAPTYGGSGRGFKRKMVSPRFAKKRKRRKSMFNESRKHSRGKK